MNERKRRHGAKTKTGVMASALVLTGIFEFLENIEDGDNVLTAAGKAYDRTKARGEAIKEASHKVSRKIRAGEI